MKKHLLLFAMGLTIFASSCKKSQEGKDSAINQSSEKFPVQFSLNTFTQTITDIKSDVAPHISADTLSNSISILYCRIYDSFTRKLVYMEDQNQANVNFGKISSVLSNGSYYAIFVGAKSPLLVDGGATVYTYDSFNVQIEQSTRTPDLFVNKMLFTVSNAPLIQEVKLNRVVAGLNVVIEDAIPSGVKNVEVIISNEQNTYRPADSLRSGSITKTVNFPLAVTDVGIKGKILRCYALKINTPISVIIKAYSASDVLIFEKTIPNVTCYANKVTSLTGKVFMNNAAFTVSTNAVWDTPLPVVTF